MNLAKRPTSLILISGGLAKLKKNRVKHMAGRTSFCYPSSLDSRIEKKRKCKKVRLLQVPSATMAYEHMNLFGARGLGFAEC